MVQNRRWIWLLVFALIGQAALMALAAKEHPLVPNAVPGVKIITTEELKGMLGKAVLLDNRTELEFKEGHLPGAKLVPYHEKSEKSVKFDAAMDKIDFASLAKEKPTVFYCNGPRCWKSYKSVVAAVKQGFKKVYWYRDGFPEWKTKGQPVESGE